MATKKHDGQKLYEKFIDYFRESYPKLTKQVHVFFNISNQFISNQGSGFLKITIEYNGLLLC